MNEGQEERLRALSKSSVVGGDIKAAMDEIDRLRKSTRVEKLIGIINDLLDQFSASGSCDCGGSLLCRVCRAQRAVNQDFMESFPGEGVPYSHLEIEELT